MTRLTLPRNRRAPLTLLCLGAHSDDIEIGCGGTLLFLKERYPNLYVHWVVFSASAARAEEATRSAGLFTGGCGCDVQVLEFRDGFLPYQGADVKEVFEALKTRIDPHIIFTHWRDDAHQDHRLLSELTWNTFRDHLVLEYEIPKYDGDMGRPNLYVPLDTGTCGRKCDYLMEAFPSQSGKRWFSRDVFLGLLRLRGMEANASSGYAEAFHARKLVLYGDAAEED
ncbi:MAG: PIG-L family deacetylase [Bryobacterales bacterium]|nr:PIG-L family deacetylase [Bryobacterales bacterium]